MTRDFQLHSHLVLLQEDTLTTDRELLDPSPHDLLELSGCLMSDALALLDERTFDCCASWIKAYPQLAPSLATDLASTLLESVESCIQVTKQDLEDGAQYCLENDKKALEMSVFLLHWLILTAETNSIHSTTKLKKPVKSNSSDEEWSSLRVRALISIQKLVLLPLDRIFKATSERDVVINLVYKTLGLFIDISELMKVNVIKETVSEILCICASRYNSEQAGLKNRILYEYLREEYLADFVAETLDSCIVTYEHVRLVDDILVEISGNEYSDKEKSAKAVAKFLITFSHLQPKEFLKHMVQLKSLLDSESYTIRCAMIEALANIIHFHLANDDSESAATNLNNFYDILMQRFNDVSYFVRMRVLKVISRLTKRHEDSGITDIPVPTRFHLVELTIRRLKDKSSFVRKWAVSLLTSFIETSPFIAIAQDQGSLSMKFFQHRVDNLTEVIKTKFPESSFIKRSKAEVCSDIEINELAEIPVISESSLLAPDMELKQLRGLLIYYTDGLKFITQIFSCCDTVCELLGSTVKTELVACMKFFAIAHRFDMECAQVMNDLIVGGRSVNDS